MANPPPELGKIKTWETYELGKWEMQELGRNGEKTKVIKTN